MQFKSLQNNQIGFEVDRYARHDMNGSAIDWGKQLQTYGDGNTQHSHAYALKVEQMGDFLTSLASYLWSLSSEEARDEEIAVIAGVWPQQRYSRSEVKFFMYLRPKEEKTTYYNRNELCVSASAAKRYDKRWAKVPAWATGTPETIYTLLTGCWDHRDYNDALTRFLTYWFIKETVYEETSRLDGMLAEAFIHSSDKQLHTAICSVSRLVDAYFAKAGAKRSLESYLSNLQYLQERETTEKEEKAA